MWSKHIHTGMRIAGRRRSILTLKMYKVFSKSYRKQSKQASLLENSTFMGFADVLASVKGLPPTPIISFLREGQRCRCGAPVT